MKAKFGTVLMVLGSVLVLSALGLFLLNQREARQAVESVSRLMPQVAGAILERQERSEQELTAETTPRQTDPPSVILPAVPVTESGGAYELGKILRRPGIHRTRRSAAVCQ